MFLNDEPHSFSCIRCKRSFNELFSLAEPASLVDFFHTSNNDSMLTVTFACRTEEEEAQYQELVRIEEQKAEKYSYHIDM